MKVSLNWIKEFTGVSLNIDELVTKIGAQLGAVENVTDFGKKYQGIVVASVVSCQNHPNADKLKICAIDDGGITPSVKRDGNGYVKVVCGAPEVHEGMLVAWIPPGSVVPSTFDKDSFTLESKDIRGEQSEGMLGTPRELAVSDDHSRLLVVDQDVKPGTPFAQVYGLDDYIIDIENKMFTHRPDLFGMLGVAREIAGISAQPFVSPTWYTHPAKPSLPRAENLPMHIVNDVPDLSLRVSAVVINNIKVGPSPYWLQATLSRLGVKSINNIVDITNYMMHLTAQPMHAFDYDKIKKYSGDVPTLGPRLADEGEELVLLGNKQVLLTKSDLVIATDKRPIDLAGIMGGADTEVDADTTAIVLTCTAFDMYSIRRSSMRHGIFNEAASRNNKGQSAAQIEPIVYKTLNIIAEICTEATQASDIFDLKSKAYRAEAKPVSTTSKFINAHLGVELSAKDIQRLLENVEFKIDANGDELTITAPFWRTDIEIPEDIVEEIGRLYGYDHIPLMLPARDLTPIQPDSLISLKSKVRETLAKAGANELLTYSFVHGNLIDKANQDRQQAFKLANALSPELQYYRMSLVPSLLDKVHSNIKSGYEQFALFEIGKTHDKSNLNQDGLPTEEERLAFVFTGDDKIASQKYAGAPYYHAKEYLNYLLTAFGIEAIFEPSTIHDPQTITGQQCLAPFDRSRTSYVKTKDGLLLGFIGELDSNLGKALKLPRFTAAFELDLQHVASNFKQTEYVALSRFPKVQQDISLKVPASTAYKDLFDVLGQHLLHHENTHAQLEPLDIYQREEDSEHKQMTFRLTISHYQKTLTSEEVNAMLDQTAMVAQKELGAERI